MADLILKNDQNYLKNSFLDKNKPVFDATKWLGGRIFYGFRPIFEHKNG